MIIIIKVTLLGPITAVYNSQLVLSCTAYTTSNIYTYIQYIYVHDMPTFHISILYIYPVSVIKAQNTVLMKSTEIHTNIEICTMYTHTHIYFIVLSVYKGFLKGNAVMQWCTVVLWACKREVDSLLKLCKIIYKKLVLIEFMTLLVRYIHYP